MKWDLQIPQGIHAENTRILSKIFRNHAVYFESFKRKCVNGSICSSDLAQRVAFLKTPYFASILKNACIWVNRSRTYVLVVPVCTTWSPSLRLQSAAWQSSAELTVTSKVMRRELNMYLQKLHLFIYGESLDQFWSAKLEMNA